MDKSKTAQRKPGRPAGVRNKKSAALRQAINSSGMTPLDYLLSVFTNEKETTNVRLDAAKAAAPYCHPKLATIDMNHSGTVDLVHQIQRTIVKPGD